MKKRFIGLALAAIMALNLFGMIAVNAKAVADVAAIPLSYLDTDDDWNAASGSVPAFPKTFTGFSTKTTIIEAGTRVTGGDAADPISAAKAPDDTYLMHRTLPEGVGGESYLNIISSNSDRVLLTTDPADVITVTMDFATSFAGEELSISKHLFAGGFQNKVSGSGNTWPPEVVTIKANGTLGSATFEANTWHNVAIEIGSTTDAKAYKYYLDGVQVGSGTLPGIYIAYLRTGFNANANVVDDLYLDNIAMYKGEPYTRERYKVNKDAAALSFIRHMRAGGEENGTDTKDAVTASLTLPQSIPDGEGSTITWASDNESVINPITGVVYRPNADTTVKLTATVTNGDKTSVKEFDLLVKASEIEEPEEVVNAKAELHAMINANLSKTSEDYSEDSFAVFEEALKTAQSIVASYTTPLEDIEAAVNALESAINGLMVNTYENATLIKDTFVNSSEAFTDTNYGDATALSAKRPYDNTGTDARRGFVGFNIENIATEAPKILLQLYISQMGSDASYADTVRIHASSSEWDEYTVNWNNAPAVESEVLASYGPANIHPDNTNTADEGGFYSFDVTEYVKAQKNLAATEVSFAIASDDHDDAVVVVFSKEMGTDGWFGAKLLARTSENLEALKLADLDAIHINDYINDEDVNSIKTDLKTLPDTGSVNGFPITWTSSNTEIISNDGKVTLPNDATAVTLTATIYSDGVTHSKDFVLTVKARSAFAKDVDALDFDDIRGANTLETKIIYNLTLPAKGESGSTDIEWASDRTDVISTDGTVIRDALADVQEVKLTATLKGTGEDAGSIQTKEFFLRVYGDLYMLDDAVNTEKPYYHTADIRIKTEGIYRIKGWGHSSNGRTGQYLIYNAAEGSSFSVETVVSTVNIGTKRTTFEVSADDVTYTPFTAVAETDTVLPTGTFGGYSIRTYTSTEALPAGTKYLKLVIPDTSRAWHQFIEEIKIVDNSGEITFADIKGSNCSADVITDDLVLPAEHNGSTIQWSSSDPAVIAADGTVTRPETDAVVKLTAVITEGEAVTTKYYDLTVKAYTTELAFGDPWIFRENAEGLLVPFDKDTEAYTAGNMLMTEFTATNLTGSDKDIYAMLVVYSSSGRMLDVGYEKITVSSMAREESETVTVTLADETEGIYTGATVKVFIWDAGTLRPIGTVLSVTRTV